MFADFQSAIGNVQQALLALKYERPDMNPLTADFTELAQALSETGRIPPGVTPERYAAMVIFYLKNQDEVGKL